MGSVAKSTLATYRTAGEHFVQWAEETMSIGPPAHSELGSAAIATHIAGLLGER